MPHPEHNNRVEPTSHQEKSAAPATGVVPNRTALLKHAYLIAIGIWAGWCVLCPTWRGVRYRFDTGDDRAWIENGAFGITGSGSSPFHRRSFLWNPPGPSGALSATYRWPFLQRGHPFVNGVLEKL